jgi:hypothetical protein
LPSTEVECSKTDRCAPQTELPPDVVSTPFVIGQPDAQTTWLSRGLNRPQGVAIFGGKLFVADTDNNRVLIWNTLPTVNNPPADIVLGQEQLSIEPTNVIYLLSSLIYPTRMSSDGTWLAVSSDGPTANRLIFYNQMPLPSNARNRYYLEGNVPPSAIGPRTFGGCSPLYAGGHLYLSDRSYNRMLMWDAIPASSSDANRAIGQATMTTGMANPSGVGLAGFNGPEGTPASDGTKLFVPDTRNHRVLVWNSLPTTNAAANYVLGQVNGMQNSPNRGGTPGLETMNEPVSLSIGGNHLAVADRLNHRVLLWNNLPTGDGQTADLVLGQTTASSVMANQGGLSAGVFNRPSSVATDGTHVAVADTDNHRVLLWNSWPASNGAEAEVIVGQALPNGNYLNGRVPTIDRLLRPVSVARAGSRLVVVDRDAHRVLLWPRLPTLASEKPDLVLGQSDFTARLSNANDGVSARGLDTPTSASSDGTLLAIADSLNNRVLIWRSIPTQIQQPADLVLGQPDMSSDVFNLGGPAMGLDTPHGVFVRNGRVYVADTDNHRVLIWKTIPTQNRQRPDIVLGQADMNGNNAHGGGTISSLGMRNPTQVYADDSHIYVSDAGNLRVLVFNTIDPTSGQAADLVLGQPDFSSNVLNLTPNAAALATPTGLDVFRGALYIADAGYHRISVFEPLPDRLGQAASRALGQSSLTSSVANVGGIDASTVQAPAGLLVTEIGIYIADAGNHRVAVLPPPPL